MPQTGHLLGFLGRTNHDRPRACLHVLYPVVENGDAKRSPGDSAVNLIWNASASHGTTRGWGGGRLQIHVHAPWQTNVRSAIGWAPTALRSLGFTPVTSKSGGSDDGAAVRRRQLESILQTLRVPSRAQRFSVRNRRAACMPCKSIFNGRLVHCGSAATL